MTTGSQIITWLGEATGNTPQPPPAVSSLTTADSRCVLFEDPDLTAAQHQASLGGSRLMVHAVREPGSNLGGSDRPGNQYQLWWPQPNSKAQVLLSGECSVERVRGCSIEALRMYHRMTTASHYPRYMPGPTIRTGLYDNLYRTEAWNREMWYGTGLVFHPSMFHLPNGPGIIDFHHLNLDVQTPWSLRMTGSGLGGSTASLTLILRSNTKVETDGTWTIAPIDTAVQYSKSWTVLNNTMVADKEIKLILNWRDGYSQAMGPKFRIWAKIGNTWLGNPAGSPIIDINNYPIGHNQSYKGLQVRCHHLYNTILATEPDVFPEVNNIPNPGNRGLRYWSRGTILVRAAAPAAGEPILNEQVLMGWVERPALV